MTGPVVAIGWDAADATQCRAWMEEGLLPNLRRLRDRGSEVPLRNWDYFCSETSWTNFFTGVAPTTSGFWNSIRYRPDLYSVESGGAYDYEEFPPFYALGEDYRVAAIDLPQAALHDDVSGIQVLAYGSHTPFTPRVSRPAALLPDLIARYGEHVAGQGRDRGRLWQRSSLELLRRRLIAGAGRRAELCRELMGREPWDLFLTVFSEFHSGSHLLLHLTDPKSPWYGTYRKTPGTAKAASNGADDPMRQVAAAVDGALGRLLDAVPEDARVLVFSQEGMVPNYIDAPTMVFLPELLYRHSFPGRQGLAGGRPGSNQAPPPPVARPRSLNWSRAIWAMKADPNPVRRALRKTLPMELGRWVERIVGAPEGFGYPKDAGPYWFLPTLWYSRDWPRMKAFCLPTFSDGCVRVNLKGREPRGIVEPRDYDSVCEELTNLFLALRNPRSGAPIVKAVLPGRESPFDDDPRKSPADLIVQYREESADMAEHPTLGSIGPLPPCRSGSHSNEGFLVAAGPGIAEGARLPEGRVIDLAPTILSLLRAPIPDHLEGRALLA